MINHARTLLLNQSANRTSPADAGYEYVPSTYKETPLPTTLETIHNIIFGKTPDNYFRNYRARELLSYLHQTELADHVYRLDPRVTYWPAMTDNKLYSAPRKVFLKQLAGEANRLALGGTVNPSNATGRSEYEYTIIFGYRMSPTGNGDLQPVFIVQPEPKIVAPTVTIFDTLRDVTAIPLVESNLSFRLGLPTSTGRLTTELDSILVIEDYSETFGGEILLEQIDDILGLSSTTMSFTAPPFAATPFPLLEAISNSNLGVIKGIWNVAARVNPGPALISVLPNLEFLGEPTYLELFGVVPDEPYRTFKNLWEEHPLPAYRLSGIVLALIYRINELTRV
jgi:hypothetical protein